MPDSAAVVEHWPRVGYPILPAVYRSTWFDEPLPTAVCVRVGLPLGTTMGDLDNSIWDRVSDRRNLRLVANYVLALTNARLYHGADQEALNRTLFDFNLPRDTRVEDLPLSNRTLNALRAADKLVDLGWVRNATAAEFLALSNVGSRTLLDFMTVVEQHCRIFAASNATEAAEVVRGHVAEVVGRIRRELPVRDISLADPRFQVDGIPRVLLDDALSAVIARATEVRLDDAKQVLKQVTELERELTRIGRQKLDVALNDLLFRVAGEKYAAPMAARWGWNGDGGCTLEAAADSIGVSRERVRQIEKRTRERIPPTAYVPALDNAIAVLEDAAVSFHPDAGQLLMEKGVTTIAFKPYGVLLAARVLGRETTLIVNSDGRSVRNAGDEHFGEIRDGFRSLADVNYVASVSEFQARVDERGFRSVGRETASRIVGRHPNCVWLDSEREWFWLKQRDGRNRYVNAALKILSIAGSVRLETLREGVLRHHRTKGLSLPRHVFQGLCRAAGLRVQGDEVTAREILSPKEVLAPIELTLFEILREHENALPVYDLRDRCVAAGINRHSFYVYLSYSPIIIRCAPAIWGLRGTSVDPARIARLLDQMPERVQTLRDHGWTPDGAVWVAYEVTRNIFDSGVLSIPAAVRDVLGAGKFELYAVDGARVGTLNLRNLSTWGVAPFIARRGVEIGDYLVLAFDAELQMCVIHAGAAELVDMFIDGNAGGPRKLIMDGAGTEGDRKAADTIESA